MTYYAGCNFKVDGNVATSHHTCGGCFYFSKCTVKQETETWDYNIDKGLLIIRKLHEIYALYRENYYGQKTKKGD